MVAAQDEEVIEVVVQEVEQIFPHRVGCALIPRSVGERLLRREDFHEAAGEMVHFVGLRECAGAARWN